MTKHNSAEAGRLKITWAERCMPVLKSIRERFEVERPLENTRISACLHVTAESAALVRTLQAGGAQVRLCASNPLSTQDDVAASLSQHDGLEVYAQRGADRDTYYQHIQTCLEHGPHLTLDDGADLVRILHTERRDLLTHIIGGTEETTTGVVRLRSMARESVLTYPVIAVNDARTKHHFDNRYGTGQSTIEGILRATHRLLAGSVFVVCGYGWCGRGVAMRAVGMGARVVVTEVLPLRALEAAMDGHHVMPIAEAARIGDFFCTVTGNTQVIGAAHFKSMKDGAVLCNAGHFDVEIDLEALKAIATERHTVRQGVEAWRLNADREIFVLEQGRLVNLAAAEGHPPDVMDLSFSNQALCAEHLMLRGSRLDAGIHPVPDIIDDAVASLKLAAFGVKIDTLTSTQQEYLEAWQHGT